MDVLVLFGAPYSGKGTQGSLLAQRLDYKHLSTGDVLRQEKQLGTQMGIMAQEYSGKGLLAPDSLLEELVDRELGLNVASKGVILDGYPRTLAQAATLLQLCQKYQVEISKVIFLEVEAEELLARGIERGKTSNRADDKDPAVIAKRIEVYHAETKPVAAFFAKMNLVVSVDGQGPIEEVTRRILQGITNG